MNNYNCDRCGYSTDRKGNFKSHLFRKKVCPAKKEDININLLRNKYGFITSEKSYPKVIPNLEKGHPKVIPNCQKSNPKIYNCEYCEKEFKFKQGKYKHQKKHCPVKKEKDKFKNILLQKENEMQKKEIKWEKEKQEMMNQISKLIEKAGNKITVNNNIQLNNYGNENLKHLSKELFKKLIESPYKSIPGLIKNIHFNEECPENKNIRITNKKLPYAEVFKDNKWEICNKTEIVNEMVSKNSKILDTQYEELKEKLPTETNKKYDTFKKTRDWDWNSRKNVLQNAEIAILNGSKKENEMLLEENRIISEE
jgi:hypothetical protein